MKFLRALLLAVVCAAQAEARAGYLFVSSPSNKTIFYSKLLTAGQESRNEAMMIKKLYQGKELERPLGLAVDSSRGVLYVADAARREVLGFRVYEDSVFAGSLSFDGPFLVMSDISAHWLSVNSVGSLFVSDPKEGRILTVPAEKLKALLEGGELKEDVKDVYSQENDSPVRFPQGVAANGRELFWANGQHGQEVGAVVRGLEEIGPSLALETTKALSKDSDSAFGVCLTSSRLYYTAREHSMYSLRADGVGRRVTVSNRLQEPRGCAYDGEGTVFVADRKAGRVFSFAGAEPNLAGSRIMSPVLEVGDAYGVAVLVTSSALGSKAWTLLLAACLALVAFSW